MITAKRYPLVLLGLSSLLFFFVLGGRDFWAPVEPRYGEIVRVLFARSEWIVPTVNGAVYTDKPILFFWLSLIASKLFGAVSEFTVRFPAALGGIGFILSTYFFVRDFFSARIGLMAAAILATSLRVIWEARWAHVDMIFCCWFMLTIYCAARSLLGKGGAYEILLAYVFMALAVLTKGLIGVVLPGLVFAAYMFMRRDWRMIGAAKLHFGIPILLLVVAPWLLLVQHATDGLWLKEFIYVHHWKRYVAGAGHRQPVYYYLTTLPVDLLPWTIFAIPALIRRWPFRQSLKDRAGELCLCWFLAVFIFFTCSDTKRELYLLPLLPTVALFIACYFDSVLSMKLDSGFFSRWLPAIFFFLLALSGLLAPVAAWKFRGDAWLALVSTSAVLLVGGALAGLFLLRQEPGKAMIAIVGLMTLTIVTTALWLFPYLETFKSPRPFAGEINRLVPRSVPLYIFADSMHDFNYYTQRETIPVLVGPTAVENLITGARASFLLVRERDMAKLPMLSRAWAVASDGKGRTPWHLLKIGPEKLTNPINEPRK